MSAIDNIKIRQTWIEEEAERVAKELEESLDMGLLYLASSLLLDCAPVDIEEEDIVDGGQDKQIDLIHIEDDREKGHADITIIQAKRTEGFSSNIAIQIRNGLDWIFERPKIELEGLNNSLFREKIEEVRALRTDYGASNLAVRVYHITNGDKSSLSLEYLEEAKVLGDKYGSVGFGSFIFDQLGAHELIEILNEDIKSKRQIDLKLPIVYDVNRPSIMEFTQGDTKSFVCTVKGAELAKAASTTPRDAIFDLNVRLITEVKGQLIKIFGIPALVPTL